MFARMTRLSCLSVIPGLAVDAWAQGLVPPQNWGPTAYPGSIYGVDNVTRKGLNLDMEFPVTFGVGALLRHTRDADAGVVGGLGVAGAEVEVFDFTPPTGGMLNTPLTAEYWPYGKAFLVTNCVLGAFTHRQVVQTDVEIVETYLSTKTGRTRIDRHEPVTASPDPLEASLALKNTKDKWAFDGAVTNPLVSGPAPGVGPGQQALLVMDQPGMGISYPPTLIPSPAVPPAGETLITKEYILQANFITFLYSNLDLVAQVRWAFRQDLSIIGPGAPLRDQAITTASIPVISLAGTPADAAFIEAGQDILVRLLFKPYIVWLGPGAPVRVDAKTESELGQRAAGFPQRHQGSPQPETSSLHCWFTRRVPNRGLPPIAEGPAPYWEVLTGGSPSMLGNSCAASLTAHGWQERHALGLDRRSCGYYRSKT